MLFDKQIETLGERIMRLFRVGVCEVPSAARLPLLNGSTKNVFVFTTNTGSMSRKPGQLSPLYGSC